MQKTVNTEIHWVKNQHFLPEYNEEELSFFQDEEIHKVHEFQKTHKVYTKTPLYQLRNLAKHLGVADFRVKDESQRFGLNAFKVMGGIYAVGKYLAELLGESIENLSFAELQSPRVKEKLGELTFISATDGNHGRGVAWAARELGQKSVIYLPKGSSSQRLEAIRNEGAEADITQLNYDDTVRLCADLASENGWIMVQDTAWEGYDHIPLWIMQGYASMAKEIVEDINEDNGQSPSHIFLQAGVGSFAAAIAGYMVQHYRDNPPKIIVVEPDQADCYYRSFSSAEGKREKVTGDMNTIMAGLACGEPNTRAFRILRQYALGAFSCPDSIAALGMRVYGNPLKNDPRVVSGESGAVTLGLLYYLRKNNPQICEELLLNSQSRVLLISTEGDTDAQDYQRVVWEGHCPL
ncbi:diaminopropionate ammonia-lyase [Bacillus sp. S/N-304-OC-R1]|uniref:diaminopropionate ammonia-lyase n=1 Tax=Bacillus sp. S/N-304-OC-R1 TaxID=2758034 RepID=UPI001C8D3A75|nr:diaminopropionate ammonia-lyase [Bacillus sp. S/N-304-OC-R1]MBY0121844.1 diaminopropionate ammonia-lyase [Bacillus sp. S/N-304-OC-R1]